jgi:hypothetical protein
MELKDFISKTLKEVLDGVSEARKTHSGRLPVDFDPKIDSQILGFTRGHANQPQAVQGIEFDIAVTVSSSDKLEGDAGIKVVGIGVSGKASTEAEKSSVSRIKFAVPVRL